VSLDTNKVVFRLK